MSGKYTKESSNWLHKLLNTKSSNRIVPKTSVKRKLRESRVAEEMPAAKMVISDCARHLNALLDRSLHNSLPATNMQFV